MQFANDDDWVSYHCYNYFGPLDSSIGPDTRHPDTTQVSVYETSGDW